MKKLFTTRFDDEAQEAHKDQNEYCLADRHSTLWEKDLLVNPSSTILNQMNNCVTTSLLHDHVGSPFSSSVSIK